VLSRPERVRSAKTFFLVSVSSCSPVFRTCLWFHPVPSACLVLPAVSVLVVCCLGRNVFALRRLFSWSLSRLARLSFVLACGFVLLLLPVSSCLPCPFWWCAVSAGTCSLCEDFVLGLCLVLLACLSCLPVVSSCSLCLSRLACRVRFGGVLLFRKLMYLQPLLR
jgi:hypothetical protein